MPDFKVLTREGEKRYCCEGYLGIYRMLNKGDIIETVFSEESH